MAKEYPDAVMLKSELIALLKKVKRDSRVMFQHDRNNQGGIDVRPVTGVEVQKDDLYGQIIVLRTEPRHILIEARPLRELVKA